MNHIHKNIYAQMMTTYKDILNIDYPYIRHQIECLQWAHCYHQFKHILELRYKILRIYMIRFISISTSSTVFARLY